MSASQPIPLSFYLKLEEGKHADLEVVSRASIELIGALRDFIEFAEPDAQLKMTIQQGDEGSLNLKTFVHFFSGRSEEDRKRRELVLGNMIKGASFFLLELTANHYGEKVLDQLDAYVAQWFQEDPETATMPEDDKAALKKEVTDALRGAIDNQTAAPHIRKFYSEVKRDPSIAGVALMAGHQDEEPETIIPREQFSGRSSEPEPAEEKKPRTRIERQPLLLLQPRLHADKKAWRFSVGGMEFAAKIEDENFVSDMLSGKLPVPAVEGVYFDADLTITEEFEGGAWVVKNRKVTKVHDVIARPEQKDLLSSVDQQNDGSHGDYSDRDE